VEQPLFTARIGCSLADVGTLHLCIHSRLQTGYRHPICPSCIRSRAARVRCCHSSARHSLLGEAPTAQSISAWCLIVGGILLVAGLVGHHERAPARRRVYGLLTGAFIAAYTLNDGYAVKVLLISPFLIDFTGNLFRMLVLAPRAWRDRARGAPRRACIASR
jgi:hypothetical protein